MVTHRHSNGGVWRRDSPGPTSLPLNCKVTKCYQNYRCTSLSTLGTSIIMHVRNMINYTISSFTEVPGRIHTTRDIYNH
ncbi:hypothetical protein BBBOND_0202940 [Babesia bigemina]|uniref:Uncharacterized protein n=1 Tax=Babesia bigemina TaxID=5866 RepID=A0A061D516_BABBI|nr:hypothetical protein BBBOND_0202940 [Babesia bigemina]CDR95137.1 hypothetical protein BBBOND_0202940 [Babesia bigemina]|eukprot:XP_012767323.1 hypothetical protein BBBOND_0202940 [Babesia bigemina]